MKKILDSIAPGQKYKLCNDIQLNKKVYPKGLVISIVSVKLTMYNKIILFRIIRNKKIIDLYYDNIPSTVYTNKWGGFESFKLRNSGLDLFNEDNMRLFTEEYKHFTK